MSARLRVFRNRRLQTTRPLAAQIAALFANGEQGLWYDVEGFRDAWNNVGPELLPEGTFDSAAGWNSIEPGWTVAGGKASVNNVSGSTVRLQRGLVPSVDRWYLITVEISSISSGSIFVTHGGGTGPAYTKPGKYSFFNYRTANFSLYIGATTGTVADLESISVKEWTGLQTCPLFQDAVGSLPAYMPGQGQVDPPIGLVMDRRKGITRGPEMLTNGDFSAGATGWNVSNADVTHIATFSGGTLRYQSDTTSPVLLVSQVGPSIVAGRWYEVTIVVSSWTSGGIKTDTLNGNAASGLILAQGAGTFRVIGLASASTSSFGISRSSANVDLTIDSISVREVLGNHAFQTTTASRPTLSARYNLLIKSQDLSDTSAWANSIGGTGSAPLRTANYGTAPDGTNTATRLQLNMNGGTTASDRSGVAQTVNGTTSGLSYTNTIWLKATSPDQVGKTVLLRHMAGTSYLACVLTADWRSYGRAEVAGTTYGVVTLELRGASGGASDSADFLAWGADLRAANDGVGLPPYQRVVDANTYDTAGFPLHLKFDGIDDWLQTASVDFSATDKLALHAAFRKLSDSATGILVESGVGSSAGSFNLAAPNIGLGYKLNAYLTSAAGTSSGVGVSVAFPAPSSSLASIAYDFAGATASDEIKCRFNGTPTSEVSAAGPAGVGTFGNLPLYIGRRGGTTFPFNGRIYGLLIRAGAANDSQILKVEKYLNSKAKVA